MRPIAILSNPEWPWGFSSRPVVATVQDAARRAIGEAEIFRLTVSDQETFACALLSPPPPTPAMERAFARRRALLHTE
ncbi:DUF1778 domain-containing protein [Acidithiobacillus caldus]|nr:DUF1778 domain-containing protein [Acidithiobacillus caldus]